LGMKRSAWADRTPQIRIPQSAIPSPQRLRGSSPAPDPPKELRLVDDLDPQLFSLIELAASRFACDHEARFLAHRASRLAAVLADQVLDLIPLERRQGARDDDRHPRELLLARLAALELRIDPY